MSVYQLRTADGVELELGDFGEIQETVIPFRTLEVLQEFAEAQHLNRKRKRVVPFTGYFLFDPEETRRIKREWMAEWRKLYPEVARERDRLKYQRIQASPVLREKLHQRFNAWQQKHRGKPEVRQRQNQLALSYYHRRMSTPEGRAAIQEAQHRSYMKRKAKMRD